MVHKVELETSTTTNTSFEVFSEVLRREKQDLNVIYFNPRMKS